MTGGPTLSVLRPTRLSEKDRQVSDLQVELSELRDSVELHRKKNNVGVPPPPPTPTPPPCRLTSLPSAAAAPLSYRELPLRLSVVALKPGPLTANPLPSMPPPGSPSSTSFPGLSLPRLLSRLHAGIFGTLKWRRLRFWLCRARCQQHASAHTAVSAAALLAVGHGCLSGEHVCACGWCTLTLTLPHLFFSVFLPF